VRKQWWSHTPNAGSKKVCIGRLGGVQCVVKGPDLALTMTSGALMPSISATEIPVMISAEQPDDSDSAFAQAATDLELGELD
jgi:hypothetical protein